MNNDLLHRHTIRRPGYDYSESGYYFITICSNNRECIFGDIVTHPKSVRAIHESPTMQLNDAGKIIEFVWLSLPDRFNVDLDAFQIMPNHIHMIIHIGRAINDNGAIHESPLPKQSQPKRSLLSQIIGYFKMNSSKQIHSTLAHPVIVHPVRSQSVGAIHESPSTTLNESPSVNRNYSNIPIWQRNYFEHIIRNEIEHAKIREYIASNPVMWYRDRNNML